MSSLHDPTADIVVRIAPVSRQAGAPSARVFLSSTFGDMHAERDVLVKTIFPELRRRCADVDVEFSFVDLRWGITDEQVDRGEMLPICLAEIERCHPFFIGLLGDYYGTRVDHISPELLVQHPWLAGLAGRSVTEIEISAVLEWPELGKRALFCLREPDRVANLSVSTTCERISTGAAAADLAALKDRLRSSGLPVRSYTDPAALATLVRDELWQAISAEFAPHGVSARSEDAQHRVSLMPLTRLYVGRRTSERRLDEHVAGFGPPLVVSGAVGAGKSALVANWLNGRDASPRESMFLHVVGATPASDRWDLMLQRFITWARDTLAVEVEDVPCIPLGDLLISYSRSLRAAVERSDVLFVVDGASELRGPDGYSHLCWLPDDLPEGARIILTLRDDTPAQAEARRRRWPELRVGELTTGERAALLEGALARVGRRLGSDQFARIIDAPQTRTPLYLRILIQELCAFGQHGRLSARIGHYLEAGSLDELYAKLFRRWEEDYGTDLVRQTLVFVAISREGLLEQDLFALTTLGKWPLTSSDLSPFLLCAELEISPRPGVLALTSTIIARAIERQYLSAEVVEQTSERLIDYFRGPVQTAISFLVQVGNEELRHNVAREIVDLDGKFGGLKARAYREMPWQLARAGRWNELAGLASNTAFLRWAGEQSPDEPVYWWRLLSARGFCIADAFAGELASTAECAPEDTERILSLLTELGEIDEVIRVRAAINGQHEATGHWYALGQSCMKQGALLAEKEELEAACQCYRKAEAAFVQVGDPVGAACARANISVALLTQAQVTGQFEDILKSSQILDGSLRVLQREGRTSLLAVAYNALGSSLALQGNLDRAREYLKRAEHLHRAMHQRVGLARVLQNRGLLESGAGRPDAARESFSAAIREYRNAGDEASARQIEGACARLEDIVGGWGKAGSCWRSLLRRFVRRR